MQPEILEPSCKGFPPDRRSDAPFPDPGMHGIGDLALALRSAPDTELAHADHVALDTCRISEPLLR